MIFQQFLDSPFQLSISFHKVIEQYEQVAANSTGLHAEWAKTVLKEIELYPALRDGFTDLSQIEESETTIKRLLAEMFPASLTRNEIKAITIPFQDIAFNMTERFQHILNDAGTLFNFNIRDFDNHQFYVLSCCLVMNEFYGTHFDFAKPLFYDIPTSTGIMKHYRILYNADFMEIIATDKAPKLTEDDIKLLRDSFDDIDLWKQKFPQGSYIMKGFAIMTLYDATVENSVSSLKGTLIGHSRELHLQDNFESFFRSIYRIPDLRIGFTAYDPEEERFSRAIFKQPIKSFLLPDEVEEDCLEALCTISFKNIVQDKVYFAVSDLKKFVIDNPDSNVGRHLREQHIHSFILAPIVKDDTLLGVLELVSGRTGELNSINANRLEIVLPFIVDMIDQQFNDLKNQVEALIQNEYTTIHRSVYWKFKKEAFKTLQFRLIKEDHALREITFKDVYPLYGQIDIKGSSETRNHSVVLDLQTQLTYLIDVFGQMHNHPAEQAQQTITELKVLLDDFSTIIKADTEHTVQLYLDEEVHPVLKQARAGAGPELLEAIDHYFIHLDKYYGDFHQARRKYDTTISQINEKMAAILDRWQRDAQKRFPHYFERFKTDGVEHNMYIGASIAPTKKFDLLYLHNLRLWQMQVLCEMEREHHFMRPILAYPLEVTSLILVFNTPMSIRFRMDEKRFDVDGTYNARFEIVKKRIDKACILGTTDRITEAGKMTIVYTNQTEEEEYKGYIRFMQCKKLFDNDIEMLDVEDLQGISGLKALRVKILYDVTLPDKKCFNYADMENEATKNS